MVNSQANLWEDSDIPGESGQAAHRCGSWFVPIDYAIFGKKPKSSGLKKRPPWCKNSSKPAVFSMER